MFEFVLAIVSLPLLILAISSYASNITDLWVLLGMDFNMLSGGIGSWS